MVKITDPRADRAAITLRLLRAKKINKCVKKIVINSDTISDNKLKKKLAKLDTDFSEDFDACPDTIKQELVFLWEEVCDLNALLKDFSNPPQTTREDLDKVSVNINDECKAPPAPPASPLSNPISLFNRDNLEQQGDEEHESKFNIAGKFKIFGP